MKRGKVTQKRKQSSNAKAYIYFSEVYSAAAGQAAYDHLHEGTGRQPKWVNSKDFIDWADERLLSERWSPDAVVGYAKRHELFCEELIPCTKTLYNWINAGLMRTKNSDLPEKVSRKPRKAFEPGPRRRKILGKSVEERPQKVEDREEWGHWEIDTVVGPHGEEGPALLTLVERHSRFEWLILIKNQTSQAVHQAITQLKNSLGDKAERLFKTLTSDNGSEFSSLTKAVSSVAEVYFAHPYSSWERGTSENQHRLVRRYIPKGESLARYTQVDIDRIQQWMNDRPRKLLGYATAHEVFVKAWKNEQKTA